MPRPTRGTFTSSIGPKKYPARLSFFKLSPIAPLVLTFERLRPALTPNFTCACAGAATSNATARAHIEMIFLIYILFLLFFYNPTANINTFFLLTTFLRVFISICYFLQRRNTKKAFCLLLIRKTAKRQKQILCGWMFLMSLSAD